MAEMAQIWCSQRQDRIKAGHANSAPCAGRWDTHKLLGRFLSGFAKAPIAEYTGAKNVPVRMYGVPFPTHSSKSPFGV
jgi:hypothetical protein